jgi:hypothetical protein
MRRLHVLGLNEPQIDVLCAAAFCGALALMSWHERWANGEKTMKIQVPAAKAVARAAAMTLLFVADALPHLAVAHHSGGMFDAQKTLTLQGTVKAFQWTNPHCWIQLLVQKDGQPQEWSIEMGSTTELYRSGWRPRTMRAGENLTITVHPMRDGSPGAQFQSAEGPDGQPLVKAGNAP